MLKKAAAYYLWGLFFLLLALNTANGANAEHAVRKAAITHSEGKQEIGEHAMLPAEAVRLRSQEQVRLFPRAHDHKKCAYTFFYSQHQLKIPGLYTDDSSGWINDQETSPLYLANRVLRI